MILPAGTRLGPYEVLAPIGSGGMGEVYRAYDDRLRRNVAVKVLSAKEAGGAAGRAQLLREARIASALSHPHLCTIFDVGEADALLHQVATGRLPFEGARRDLATAVLRGGCPVPSGPHWRCSSSRRLPWGRSRGSAAAWERRPPRERWRSCRCGR